MNKSIGRDLKARAPVSTEVTPKCLIICRQQLRPRQGKFGGFTVDTLATACATPHAGGRVKRNPFDQAALMADKRKRFLQAARASALELDFLDKVRVTVKNCLRVYVRMSAHVMLPVQPFPICRASQTSLLSRCRRLWPCTILLIPGHLSLLRPAMSTTWWQRWTELWIASMSRCGTGPSLSGPCVCRCGCGTFTGAVPSSYQTRRGQDVCWIVSRLVACPC